MTECPMQCSQPRYYEADYEDAYYDLVLKCAHGCAEHHERYNETFRLATADTPGWPNYDQSNSAESTRFWNGAKDRCKVSE